MPRIPKEIQAAHVQHAIEAISAGISHGFGEVRLDYDVLHRREKRYPPKAIVGIAAEFATGKRLQPSHFSSGIGTGGGAYSLYDLGFSIVNKGSKSIDVFATPMFVPGEVYKRRELHQRYGGQQQGGISSPKDYPNSSVFSPEILEGITATLMDFAKTELSGTPAKDRSATCR